MFRRKSRGPSRRARHLKAAETQAFALGELHDEVRGLRKDLIRAAETNAKAINRAAAEGAHSGHPKGAR